MYNNTLIIAEVKPVAPNFRSDRTWNELFDIAAEHGDWVSVHTHPWWEGAFELLAEARRRTDKPILAKGFHDTDEEVVRALDCGADFVLAVGRVPQVHQAKCMIEPYTVKDFCDAPTDVPLLWNSRDIRALRFNTEPQERPSFAHVRTLRPTAWICQASNLKTVDDIDPTANAVLVGTHLESFVASLKR